MQETNKEGDVKILLVDVGGMSRANNYYRILTTVNIKTRILILAISNSASFILHLSEILNSL